MQVSPAELGIESSLPNASCLGGPRPAVDIQPHTAELGKTEGCVDLVTHAASILRTLPFSAPFPSPVGSPTQGESHLLEMGFSIKEVRRALRARKNNVEEAANWLFEHANEGDGESDLDEELPSMRDDYVDLPALVAAEENVSSWPAGRITEVDDNVDVNLGDFNAIAPEPRDGVEWHGGDGGWKNGGIHTEPLASTAEEHDDDNVGSQAKVPAAISRPRRKVRRGLMELQKLFAFMQVSCFWIHTLLMPITHARRSCSHCDNVNVHHHFSFRRLMTKVHLG